ncbi:M23 family metallopeptidase [Krasilnikovia sp. MM14-A1259]|uniref:M23 family metallopeptidase n=1 Tax=Krasilnikovia sp. MM14-A1259 TaxID=3373539 RepID=UPI0037F6222A
MISRRALLGAALAVLLAGACAIGTVASMFMDVYAPPLALAGCGKPAGGAPSAGPLPGTGKAFREWDISQVGHATTIVAAGKQLRIPARGWVIAVATAMQESTLQNLANTNVPRSLGIPHEGSGHDHDSVGLFQQRPNPPDGEGSWGTVQELMTPATAATKFYRALQHVPGWQTMDLAEAAQRVQRSSFPDAYAKWETKAGELVAHVEGVTDIGQLGGAQPSAPCGQDSPGLDDIVISPAGWTEPVHAPLGSGFRTPYRPNHQGVDLIAARGTPIVTAGSGQVVRVVCNSSIGTCDRDGGVTVRGCGWYVEVLHPGDVVTRYCHMGQRPSVTVGEQVHAGTLLGFVGSSGHSSGPHLHFEVHYRVPAGHFASSENARSPVDFMIRVGAPLGR